MAPQQTTTNANNNQEGVWCGIITSVIIGVLIMFASFTQINSNETGIFSRFGRVTSYGESGLNSHIPFITDVYKMKSGFDTDFTTKESCITMDDVKIVFPRIYVDNQFNCTRLDTEKDKLECLKTLYINHFINDAKIKSKINYGNIPIVVPEEGLIFKYMREVLTDVCKKYTSYEMITPKLNTMNIEIRDALKTKVPFGQEILSVRLERPIIPNENWRTSVLGIGCSNIHMLIRRGLTIGRTILF